METENKTKPAVAQKKKTPVKDQAGYERMLKERYGDVPTGAEARPGYVAMPTDED